jgi:glycine cleavage system T protein
MAKQSILSEFHKSNGAVFVERDGWLLPAHYGDPAAEYQAVRSAVGFSDISHRALLQVTGPDRLPFLQGMLSNDLRLLKPGEGQYAAVLNQQGKVLADVRVLRSDNSFYVDLWDSVREKIAEHLNRYLVADEVEIADRSDDYQLISVQGPRSKALLQSFFNRVDLPDRLMQHVMVDIVGASACVVCDSHTGEAGFDLFVTKLDLTDFARSLTQIGASFSARWVGEEAQEILRLEAGIPRYGIDFTDDNLLLEAGLRDAVSFTKGCYLGQEVVERIRSRGHVNKKLMGLLIDAPQPQLAGDAVIASGRGIGSVTSSAHSPALGRTIALAYINKDYWLPGASVLVHHGGAPIAATVTELPFVKPPVEPRSSP